MTNLAVLVTGASSGIGLATSLHLAARGFRVFASVRKSGDAGPLRYAATPVILDVTEDRSIRAASELLDRELGSGGLFGLVNNAGIAVSGPLEFIDLGDVRRQLEVNLLGPIALTQAFLPLVRRAKGRIVNMSSISGRVASPLLGPYAISKFALEAFSDSLRRELEPFGIFVSVIEPGVIRTPIWDKGVDSSKERIARMPAEALEKYGPRIDELRGRAQEMSANGAPAEEVARAVHHALSSPKPRTRYLVGRDARLTAKLVWLLTDRTIDALLRRRFRPRMGGPRP